MREEGDVSVKKRGERRRKKVQREVLKDAEDDGRVCRSKGEGRFWTTCHGVPRCIMTKVFHHASVQWRGHHGLKEGGKDPEGDDEANGPGRV